MYELAINLKTAKALGLSAPNPCLPGPTTWSNKAARCSLLAQSGHHKAPTRCLLWESQGCAGGASVTAHITTNLISDRNVIITSNLFWTLVQVTHPSKAGTASDVSTLVVRRMVQPS